MSKQSIREWSFIILFAIAFSHCDGACAQQAPSPASKKAAAATPRVTVSRDNPCSVLFPTEVGEILGVKPSLREIIDEVTCRYHFEPTASHPAKSAGEETFVEIKISWTGGRAALAATRAAGKILGSGSSAFEKLEGIGDEAWMAPLASFVAFSKGDVGVEMDMRMIPGEKEKTVRLARLVASRL